MWSSIVVCDQMVRSTNLVPFMFDAFQDRNTVGSQLIVAETPPTNCALLVANKSLSGTRKHAGTYSTSHSLRTYIPGILSTASLYL